MLTGFEYTNGKPVLDFSYTYPEAREDNIVPPLAWHVVGRTVRWAKARNGVVPEYASTFGQDEERTASGGYKHEALINDRLRHAVYASAELTSPIAIDMLTDGVAELARYRSLQPNAGGIVFADDIPAARALASRLRAMGESAVVVTSEDPDARTIIRKFRKSDTRWVVSVGMLKEGTDIPRLRTALLLTSVKSARTLIQMIGRLLRLYRVNGVPVDYQDVSVFAVADPRIIAILSAFGEPVGQKGTGGGGGGGGGGTGRR